MRTALSLLLAVLPLLPMATSAQKSMATCSLLDTGDIGSALGESVGAGAEANSVVPSGPQKGATTYGCRWQVGTLGMLTVNAIQVPDAAARDAGLAQIRTAIDLLKSQGWTEQSQDQGAQKCSIMTPPAAETASPRVTGCYTEAKGMGIGVAFMGQAKSVPIEKVQGLLDKAVSRLP